MDSFERGWGWFYWTWDTEAAVQWSYKKGVAAGTLPPDPATRGGSGGSGGGGGGSGGDAGAGAVASVCGKPLPEFGDLPENY
jgi:glucan 1,3-beta-glucosidase